MKQLIIVPEGWECKLKDYEGGFFVFKKALCFKSHYNQIRSKEGQYFTESGGYFWGGTSGKEECDNLIIQPVIYKWIEVDE